MTSSSLVILDIGATLVQGPARGPAGRIARELGLSPDQEAILTVWVLHRPSDEPDHVVGVVNGHLDPPSTTLRSIAELAPATITSVLEETVENSVGTSVRSP